LTLSIIYLTNYKYSLLKPFLVDIEYSFELQPLMADLVKEYCS